jgi:hypothetical protein
MPLPSWFEARFASIFLQSAPNFILHPAAASKFMREQK